MQDDVETVARAIWAARSQRGEGPWIELSQHARDEIRRQAAAALSAATPGIEARVRAEVADYLDGSDGKIPMLSVFAPLVSGNNMPDMSGDARNRLLPHVRRRFDDAMQAIAAAIRKG